MNFCTYCIIPYARGRCAPCPWTRRWPRPGSFRPRAIGSWCSPASRSPPGARISNGTGLIDLMEAVSAAAPDCGCGWGAWSPGPSRRTSAAGRRLCPTCAPHFHLSLQSGCDATLHRMNRRYDTARFRQSVDLLRRYFDHPAITTDVICGFPQETEEEFSATLAFLEECRFAAMHCSPTPSARAPRRRICPRCRGR